MGGEAAVRKLPKAGDGLVFGGQAPRENAHQPFMARTRAGLHEWLGEKLKFENGSWSPKVLLHLQKAAMLAPTPNRWIKCGQVAELKHRPKAEIIKYYDCSKASGKASYSDLYFRANAYHRLGEYGKAIEDFDRLMEIKRMQIERSADPVYEIYWFHLNAFFLSVEKNDSKLREDSLEGLRHVLCSLGGLAKLHSDIVDIAGWRASARSRNHDDPEQVKRTQLEYELLGGLARLK